MTGRQLSISIVAVLAGLVGPAAWAARRHPATPLALTDQQARVRAVAILLGEPYGRTEAEVAATMRDVTLVRSGDTACGEVWRPVWSIHVVVPSRGLDGYLLLDGVTGRRVCATLPYLD